MAELFQQQGEVAVLGQYYGTYLPGCQEDLAVFGIAQAEFPDRLSLDAELRREPPRQIRRELGV